VNTSLSVALVNDLICCGSRDGFESFNRFFFYKNTVQQLRKTILTADDIMRSKHVLQSGSAANQQSTGITTICTFKTAPGKQVMKL
jgi:hypothetical protein